MNTISTLNSGGVLTLPRAKSDAPPRGEPSSSTTPVQFTPNTLRLRQVEVEANDPPMDADRIAALRAKISSGEYHIDAAKIARKFYEQEQESA